MRLQFAVAIIGLGTACASAQLLPPAAQARHLLQSQNLRDRVWGAWLAGASRDQTLREPLLAELKLAQPLRGSEPGTEEHNYIQALLDSLIQIPGPVPAEVVLPFADSWLPETLILLSRDPVAPGNESALLQMRERSLRDPEWVAVNDLLYAGASRSFFQKTLQEIAITHDFLITDQDGIRADNGFVVCSPTTRHFAKGFPPVGVYQLRTDGQPGDILFQVYPVSLYYRRTVVPSDGQLELSDCRFSSASWERQTRLGQFLSTIDDLSGKQPDALFRPETRVRWQGSPEKVTSEIESLLAAQATAIRSLVVHAQERGLLESPGPPLFIGSTVRDLRHDRSVPLSGLGSKEIAVP